MENLNYHHLRYFYEVAQEGHLGRAAERLNVSQSALSVQIKTLEERLGHDLFDRVGRKLVMTEAGRVALDHAERIFGAGQELLAALRQEGNAMPPLRVGSLSTLSRNFQLQFLRPLLADRAYPVTLKSGNTNGLLAELEALSLDVVLTTELPVASAVPYAAQLLDEQPVGLHGVPHRLGYADPSALIRAEPLILPTDSVVRTGFEAWVARLDVTPRIVAEVDDMAMVRLLAREGAGVAVAPAVVMADEIASGVLATAPFEVPVKEPFYAVTIPRRFAHPALAALLAV